MDIEQSWNLNCHICTIYFVVFFQIEPEQALAAFESKLEREELDAWKMEITRLIEQPKEDFK